VNVIITEKQWLKKMGHLVARPTLPLPFNLPLGFHLSSRQYIQIFKYLQVNINAVLEFNDITVIHAILKHNAIIIK
jgi:hypothetical protein